MKQIVSLLAFGDALIGLSLLKQVRENGARFQVLGTDITRQVAQLVMPDLPVEVIIADKPAFNSLRTRGLAAGLHELIQVRRALSAQTRRGDCLVFERTDVRNRLLVPFGRRAHYADIRANAYRGRLQQMRELFGDCPDWPLMPRLNTEPKTVLINPCAQYRDRWLGGEVIENVLHLCAKKQWALTLVDPCRQYAEYADRVARYLPRPKLADAAAALRASDLYLGPDSFFIHLAYYYQVPHVGFFYADHLQFQPPGMERTGNWMSFDMARDATQLRLTVDRYLQG